MKDSVLIIYNLVTDDNDPVLASNSFVVSEFARHFQKVFVFSTYVGEYNQPGNVQTFEIGGGNPLKRLRALYRLTVGFAKIQTKFKDIHVFHHMSTKTLFWPGILLRILGIRQSLWYSHSVPDIYLRLFFKIVEAVFTPGESTFPIKTTRVHPVGHMIKFLSGPKPNFIRRFANPTNYRIACVGRVVRIKHIEQLLQAISRCADKRSDFLQFEVVIIGPIIDTVYLNELLDYSNSQKIEFKVMGPMPRLGVHDQLQQCQAIFQGTPLSVDKATLEATGEGLLLITKNQDALHLTGMKELWDSVSTDIDYSLEEQLRHLFGLKLEEVHDWSKHVSLRTRDNNSCEKTVHHISRIMLEGLKD